MPVICFVTIVMGNNDEISIGAFTASKSDFSVADSTDGCSRCCGVIDSVVRPVNFQNRVKALFTEI